MQDLAERFNLSGARLRLVPGGADRNLTILNVIESIEKEFGAKDEHIIVYSRCGASLSHNAHNRQIILTRLLNTEHATRR